MNSGRAVNFLRSCGGSFSSQHLTRSAVNCPRRHLLAGRRHYSEGVKAEDSKDQTIAPEEAESELSTKLKKKEEEAADLLSRLRYLQADFVNLQRNAAREKEQTKDFAISRFASDLLETVDVLSLAVKSVPEEALTPSDSTPPASESSTEKTPQAYLNELHTGVEMTHRLLLQTLFKYKIKPFDPTGDKFDPNMHEALYQAPIPGKEPGTILDCQKTGYMIKDRVLRAAQVGVVQDSS